MQSSLTNILILSTILVIIVLFLVLFWRQRELKKTISNLHTKLESSELLLDELKETLTKQHTHHAEYKKQSESWQLEHQQVSQQLEHRIKLLQTKLDAQQDLIEQSQSQQPEDKLYSRAQKMVLLGADVAELVAECDLPKAEAEMLVALHNKSVK